MATLALRKEPRDASLSERRENIAALIQGDCYCNKVHYSTKVYGCGNQILGRCDQNLGRHYQKCSYAETRKIKRLGVCQALR